MIIDKKLRVLIIGGNRFFGLHLAKNFVAERHFVTLLNRGQINDGLGDQVSRLKADRKSKSSLIDAVHGKTWDIIYDQVCYSAEEARVACEVFHGKTHRYIVTSSESVYDIGSSQSEHAFNPKSYSFTKEALPHEDYQEAKRQVETVFANSDFKETVMVRPSLVVGEDDYTGRLKWHLDRISNELPIYFPSINIQSDFIRSDQAGYALKKIGESNCVGPINCTAPDSMSLEAILNICEEVVGKKAILASTEQEKNHSPYGGTETKTMNTKLLQSLGAKIEPSESWMKNLIGEVFASKTR